MRSLPLKVSTMASSSQPADLLQAVQGDALDGLPTALPRAEISSTEWPALTARTVDVVLAFLALLVLAPLLVLVALLIRLESQGPALFRQTRTGLNGRIFRIYKFRTMRVLEDGSELQQARRGDARVTAVGRILRATSFDELPQLLNVLWGDMALVGPRPHALAHDIHYAREIPSYRLRFQVKPGITGWAQVNGARGETPTLEHMQRRVELDLWYVQHRSLALDLTILGRTIGVVLTHRTIAY